MTRTITHNETGLYLLRNQNSLSGRDRQVEADAAEIIRPARVSLEELIWDVNLGLSAPVAMTLAAGLIDLKMCAVLPGTLHEPVVLADVHCNIITFDRSSGAVELHLPPYTEPQQRRETASKAAAALLEVATVMGLQRLLCN